MKSCFLSTTTVTITKVDRSNSYNQLLKTLAENTDKKRTEIEPTKFDSKRWMVAK